MAIETRRDDGAMVIETEGRIDSGNAQAFCDQLDSAIKTTGQAIVIDMAGLVYISSAGLRAILQAMRKMERQNVRLALCSLSDDVRDVFHTSGFDQLIEIRQTREDALAAVSH